MLEIVNRNDVFYCPLSRKELPENFLISHVHVILFSNLVDGIRFNKSYSIIYTSVFVHDPLLEFTRRGTVSQCFICLSLHLTEVTARYSSMRMNWYSWDPTRQTHSVELGKTVFVKICLDVGLKIPFIITSILYWCGFDVQTATDTRKSEASQASSATSVRI